MARIRSIKPDFWTDGAVVKLSPWARLLFIGMWNFTICDRGHLPDDPVKLKLQILPMDDVDADELVDELLGSGRVDRITAGGRTFLHVRRFGDHQKLDPRWTPRCPVCTPSNSPTPPETRVSSSELPDPHPRTGQDRTGQEEPPQPPKGGTTKSPRRPSSSSYDYDADADFAKFWDAYPRKTAKPQAFKAWKAARKRGEQPDRIITAAERYRDDPTRKPDYTKHPATWLNAEGYNDVDVVTSAPASSGWWDN